MYILPLSWSGQLRETLFFVYHLRAPDDSLVQLYYLNPRLPSHLPGVEIKSVFFTVHSSPGSLLFCPPPVWGVLVRDTALGGFTGEESPGSDNSFLQSDVPEKRSGCALEANGIRIAGLD